MCVCVCVDDSDSDASEGSASENVSPVDRCVIALVVVCHFIHSVNYYQYTSCPVYVSRQLFHLVIALMLITFSSSVAICCCGIVCHYIDDFHHLTRAEWKHKHAHQTLQELWSCYCMCTW